MGAESLRGKVPNQPCLGAFKAEQGGAGEKEAGTELPPPPAQISPGLPPPESDKNPPYGEHKNQEPASGPEASGGETGVKISESKESGAGESKPTLKHIVPEDLRETARLLELHAQAVDSGLLGSSENDRLHFLPRRNMLGLSVPRTPVGSLPAWSAPSSGTTSRKTMKTRQAAG